MNKRKRRNFTLIELLAVMLLMGVLMLLMLPAFNRMIKGNKVDQLASNLKLGLEQAQSLAAASRKYVALILPSNRATWKNDETKWFCYGGFRLAYVEPTGGSDYTFVKWVPQGEWKNSPNGAMLVYADDSSPGVESGGGCKGVLGKTSGSNSEFGSGMLNLLVPDTTEAMPTGTLNHCAVVFTPYGGLKNQTMYFVVAEALDAPSDQIVYPVRESGAELDEKPTNFLKLRVNQFTGKVEYIQ